MGKFLVLAVICIAASTEAYSSGFASGSASASTYASASSYASGGAAAASASAAAPANVVHYIEAEVKLTGMSAAEFNTEANKNNFKAAIAEGMSGVSASDIYAVTAVDARRSKAVKVSFKVKVATAASAGATTLNTYLNSTTGTGFLTKLKAKGGTFANVTAITVTKAPAAKTTTTVSSVSKSAVVSLTSVLACAFLALRQ